MRAHPSPNCPYCKLDSASKQKECVCHIYEMDDDELCRFYQAMPKSYIGSEGKRFDTYGEDKVTVESEIKKRGMTLPELNESTMTDWARNELQMAGLFDKDSDYEGMLGEAVIDLIEKFAEQGHSGFSAEITSAIFDKLIHWKPLTELTNDPCEWTDLTEQGCPEGHKKLYQSRRSPDCFSEDGGLTYYSIDDPCFEGTEENGVKYMAYDSEHWAKVTIHTAKQKE